MAPNHKRASSDETEERDFPSGPETPFGMIWDEAQRRLPAGLADQLKKGVGAVQSQIVRRAAQADVDALTRRIDQLSRQVEELTARQKGDEAPKRTRRTRPAATGSETGPATKRRSKRQDAGSESSE